MSFVTYVRNISWDMDLFN